MMSTTGTTDSHRLSRYLKLLEDTDSLIKASRCLTKRKRSPFARLVLAGNQKAIIQAARNRLFSAMNKAQRIDFCRMLCELKSKLKSLSGSALRRELVSWLTSSVIGLFDTISGVVVAFLWVIRAEVYSLVCPCRLTGSCSTGSCLSSA